MLHITTTTTIFREELITYVHVLPTLNLSDITSKFRTVVMLVIVDI
jgi:hypothetical protein